MEAGICFGEHGAGEEEEWELEGLNAQSSCLQVAVMFTEMPESPESSSSPSLSFLSSLPLSLLLFQSLSLSWSLPFFAGMIF